MAQVSPTSVRHTRRVGPYSQPHVLAKLDRRTRPARMMRDLRAELIAHVGGKPSATQRFLIERAVSLAVQVALMDAKVAEGGMTSLDSRTYLAWSNSLTRILRTIGLKGAAEKPRSLAEIRGMTVPA